VKRGVISSLKHPLEYPAGAQIARNSLRLPKSRGELNYFRLEAGSGSFIRIMGATGFVLASDLVTGV
jgi:hypothetical protein